MAFSQDEKEGLLPLYHHNKTNLEDTLQDHYHDLPQSTCPGWIPQQLPSHHLSSSPTSKTLPYHNPETHHPQTKNQDPLPSRIFRHASVTITLLTRLLITASLIHLTPTLEVYLASMVKMLCISYSLHSLAFMCGTRRIHLPGWPRFSGAWSRSRWHSSTTPEPHAEKFPLNPRQPHDHESTLPPADKEYYLEITRQDLDYFLLGTLLLHLFLLACLFVGVGGAYVEAVWVGSACGIWVVGSVGFYGEVVCGEEGDGEGDGQAEGERGGECGVVLV
ncbi:hypothetical protein K402DRAFT_269949 [Aulographum hederae CBS 113979]|uniref:Uncharacterized protein n=1 Tax=Aulographum hederae CBS 113979 TaxID=1176131 RepID=A0A6G1H8D8_9PEZI|nr:hypothetical protein K402DRAFT_269949 [Aulographum hederae CBS 113979]